MYRGMSFLATISAVSLNLKVLALCTWSGPEQINLCPFKHSYSTPKNTFTVKRVPSVGSRFIINDIDQIEKISPLTVRLCLIPRGLFPSQRGALFECCTKTVTFQGRR